MRLHEFPFADMREHVMVLSDLSRTLTEVVGDEISLDDPSPLGDDTEFSEAFLTWNESLKKMSDSIGQIMRCQRRALERA